MDHVKMDLLNENSKMQERIRVLEGLLREWCQEHPRGELTYRSNEALVWGSSWTGGLDA